MKFGTQIRSSSLLINVIFEIADLEPKLKAWTDRFGVNIAMCLIFMKFGNQCKSNMLLMDILIGTDDLDRKSKICEMWSHN